MTFCRHCADVHARARRAEDRATTAAVLAWVICVYTFCAGWALGAGGWRLIRWALGGLR